MIESVLRRLALFASRRHGLVFLVAVALAGLALIPARQLRFDTDVFSLLPPEDPAVETFMETVEVFGSLEQLLVVVRIPEGARGLGWIQAANLDPDAFPDPERFDVERSPNHHIAFRYGEHFCLGAWLARMAARVVLEEWIASIEDCARAEDGPLELVPDFILRGPARLIVDVTPRQH